VPAARTGPESTTRSTTAKASAGGSFRTFYLLAYKGQRPHSQLGPEHNPPADQCIVTDAAASATWLWASDTGMVEAALA
jgi:hypothetical protein